MSYLTEWCCKETFFTAIQVRTVSICQIELSAGSVQGAVNNCAVVAHGFDDHLTHCFTNLPITCLSKLNDEMSIENVQNKTLHLFLISRELDSSSIAAHKVFTLLIKTWFWYFDYRNKLPSSGHSQCWAERQSWGWQSSAPSFSFAELAVSDKVSLGLAGLI